MIKKVVSFIAAAVLALLIIMLVRALTYGNTTTSTYTQLPAPLAYNEQSAIERLQKVVQFKTITLQSGDPRTEERASPWKALHAYLETEYPLVQKNLKREVVANYSLLYTWQGSDPNIAPLMLMAHQDVVPVDFATIDDWHHPPFAGAIADGFVYGRGTQDDKASIIAIMEAVEALLLQGYQPKRSVILAFGHDEEVGGIGAESIVKLLKSRDIAPEMVLDEGYFVVNDLDGFDRPIGLIGVAEKGYLTLDLISEAEGGHSSLPPLGSANIQLSKALLALEENQMESHLESKQVTGFFKAVAGEMSFLKRFFIANTWITGSAVEAQFSASASMNAMIRTTTAPTMLSGSVKGNVLPQQAVATVNFRIHPEDSSQDVITHVQNIVGDIEGIRVEVRDKGFFREPSPVSPTDNRGFQVLAALANKTGGDALPVPALVLAGTDATFASAISKNVYRFMPVEYSMLDIAGIHGTNERLSIQNYKRMIDGYSQLIQAMDSAE